MTRKWVWPLFACVLLGALQIGCSDTEDEARPPQLRLTETWVIQGDAAGLFRAHSAALARDGRVYVANAGTAEVRVFDSSAEPTAVFGSEGEGPDQFTYMTWLTLIEDSVAVFDAGSGHLKFFSTEGRFLSSQPLAPSGETSGVAWGAVDQSGEDRAMRVVYAAMPGVNPRGGKDAAQDTVSLRSRSMGQEGGSVEFRTVPNLWWERKKQPNGFSTRVVRDGPAALFAYSGGFIAVGDNVRPEIEILRAEDGITASTVNLGLEATSPPEGAPGVPGRYFQHLVGGDDGVFLVSSSAVQNGQRLWYRITQDGVDGELRLPARDRVLDFDSQSALVLRFSAFDEESIAIARWAVSPEDDGT